MAEPREGIEDTMRGRVIRGLSAGTLHVGDRLPSARELTTEFAVDYRVIIAAYKRLRDEGFVELRPRGGVYVAPRPNEQAALPPLPDSWLADVLVQGLNREVRGPELHDLLRRCTETLRLRAVVVAATPDQSEGLCRELRDDYGLEAAAMITDEVRGSDPLPLAIRRADLVVTPDAGAEWSAVLSARTRTPIITVTVRPELRRGEWALLLRRPVYVVVASRAFGDMVRRFYADVPGIENLRVLIHGEDDLGTIPEDAPTYVTQRVRAQLHGSTVPGRILPPARTISAESAGAIFRFIVRANIAAMSRRDR